MECSVNDMFTTKATLMWSLTSIPMYASDLFQCALLNIICGKWVLRKRCLRAQNHNATARYVIYLLCCVRYAGTCSSYDYYRPYLFVRKATAIRHNDTKVRKEWLIAEWGLILCSSKKIIQILWQNSARCEDEVMEKKQRAVGNWRSHCGDLAEDLTAMLERARLAV